MFCRSLVVLLYFFSFGHCVDRRRTDNTMAKRKKVQKDNQRSTKHTYKTKDRVTQIPLKTGGELRCSGRVRSSCSTSDSRRVNLHVVTMAKRKSTKGQTFYMYVLLIVVCPFVLFLLAIVTTCRLTRRLSLVEQELLTFPEHPSSPQVFSVRVSRSFKEMTEKCS
jgi:hypothetical protein